MLTFKRRLFCSKALVLKLLRCITSTSAQTLRIELIVVVERQEWGRGRLWMWPPPPEKCPFFYPRSTRFLSVGSRKDFFTCPCIFFAALLAKSGCCSFCTSHKQRIRTSYHEESAILSQCNKPATWCYPLLWKIGDKLRCERTKQLNQMLVLDSLVEIPAAPRLKKNRSRGNNSSKRLTQMHRPLNLKPQWVIHSSTRLIFHWLIGHLNRTKCSLSECVSQPCHISAPATKPSQDRDPLSKSLQVSLSWISLEGKSLCLAVLPRNKYLSGGSC